MLALIETFLKDFQYSVNKEELQDYYTSHPDFPSLNAVTDTLEYLGVDPLAVKVNINQFYSLPSKVISVLNIQEEEQFIYITQHNDEHVHYTDENGKTFRVNTNSFLKRWSGIVLAIDENENHPSTLPTQNSNNPLYWMFLPLLIITFQLIIHFDPYALLYQLLALLGLTFSILIVQENYGEYNAINAKMCNNEDLETSQCKSVISSKGAQIYKNFTLSDACITFFSSITLLSLYSNHQLHFVSISCIAIPVILYSLYYQAIKLKKWCLLCISIVLVLIGIILLTMFLYKPFTWREWMIANILFLLTSIVIIGTWLPLKKILDAYYKLKQSDLVHKRFKRDVNTFKSLIKTTSLVNVETLQTLHALQFGKQEAANELKLFLSPTCRFCHIAFNQAYQLLKNYPEWLSLSIYFNVNVDNQKNEYANVVKIIVESYAKQSPEKAMELIHEWHVKNPTLQGFLSNYNMDISDMSIAKIRSHFEWCMQNNLSYAPIKLFDNKLMPKSYEVADLRYFLKVYSENE